MLAFRIVSGSLAWLVSHQVMSCGVRVQSWAAAWHQPLEFEAVCISRRCRNLHCYKGQLCSRHMAGSRKTAQGLLTQVCTSVLSNGVTEHWLWGHCEIISNPSLCGMSPWVTLPVVQQHAHFLLVKTTVGSIKSKIPNTSFFFLFFKSSVRS